MDPKRGLFIHCDSMCLSTPTPCASRGALHNLGAIFSMALVLCLFAPHATALECDEGEPGACLDAGTFEWCEGGELKSAKCPEGQICVADNPFYDGAGCVSTDDTACGDISAEGECTTANGVVWCDDGVPMVYACGEESVCGWHEDNGEYDCLPRASQGSEEDEMRVDNTNISDAPPDPEETNEEAGAEPEPEEPDATPFEGSEGREEGTERRDSEHMMPLVTPTDESAHSGAAEGGEETSPDGCQGGPDAHPLLVLFAALIIWLRPRPCSGRAANA